MVKRNQLFLGDLRLCRITKNNQEIRSQKTRFFSFLVSRCNHVLKLVTLFKKRQPDASPVQFSKLVAVADVSSSKQKQISPNIREKLV